MLSFAPYLVYYFGEKGGEEAAPSDSTETAFLQRLFYFMLGLLFVLILVLCYIKINDTLIGFGFYCSVATGITYWAWQISGEIDMRRKRNEKGRK